MQTFEESLEEVCFKENPQVLDDDRPDFFDDWLEKLDDDEFIRLVKVYKNIGEK